MVMGCVMLTRPYPHPDLHIVELGKKKRRDGPFSSSFFSCQTRSHLGCSLALITPGRAREIKSKSKGIPYASLFGVGAPEALVIGVVALVVFGPKGLAEAARSLGKTLRAFQPTIREIQEVSREFKKTLEDEIGLNELASSDSVTSTDKPKQNQEAQLTMAAKAEPIESKAYSTEDYANITEKQAKELVQEEQLKVEPIESKAYSTEDYAEITEKQAKELVQEEQLRAEPIESKAYSTEDYANITEKQAKELVQEEQLRVEPIESKAYSTEEKQAKELVQEEQLRVSETKSSDGIDKNVE